MQKNLFRLWISSHIFYDARLQQLSINKLEGRKNVSHGVVVVRVVLFPRRGHAHKPARSVAFLPFDILWSRAWRREASGNPSPISRLFPLICLAFGLRTFVPWLDGTRDGAFGFCCCCYLLVRVLWIGPSLMTLQIPFETFSFEKKIPSCRWIGCDATGQILERSFRFLLPVHLFINKWRDGEEKKQGRQSRRITRWLA